MDGIIINNRYTLVPDMPGLFETITYSFLSYLGSNRPGTPGTELLEQREGWSDSFGGIQLFRPTHTHLTPLQFI